MKIPAGRGSTERAGLALALPLALLCAGCWVEDVGPATGDSDTPPALVLQIEEMLEASSRAWNEGDLEAFMADYERSPRTTYIGADGLLIGFDAIRDRFAPAFAPGAPRDSLRFEGLRVRSLGQRHALATARYVLHRDGEVTSTGPFTLVLLSVEGRWRIIHDHTSTLETAAPDTASAGRPGDGAGGP